MSPDRIDSFSPGSPQWWAAREGTSKRTTVQPGRPAFDVQRIVDVAVQIVDEEGADMLSMRKLAQRLQTGTATLYRHFKSKEEIQAVVVDQVLGDIGKAGESQPPSGWRAASAQGAMSLYGLLQRHPHIVPLLTAQIPTGPNARRLRERAIRVFLDSGFSPVLAAKGYSAVMNYVLGASHRIASGKPASTGKQLRDFYRGMEPGSFSATIAVAEVLPMVSEEEEFRFGVELLLEGLATILAKEAALKNSQA